MKTAIILHGKPSKAGYYAPERQSQSNEHWLPWLQHELIIKDILAQTPELPVPYEPVYEDWKKLFEGFEINEESVLVGHSCGGGFLTRWLSETNIKVDKLVLVAPWLDPENTIQDASFFDFKIDLDGKANEIHIFVSKDDDQDILDSVKTIKEAIKDYEHREFEGYGHFCFGDMNTKEFPELLDVCLGETK